MDHRVRIPFFRPRMLTLAEAVLGLPYQVEIEISDDLVRLDLTYFYRHAFAATETVSLRSWDVRMDMTVGRIGGLHFHESRRRTEAPYEEIFDAFRVIRSYARFLPEAAPYRWGLILQSGLFLEQWQTDEIVLRKTLTPPFPDTP